MSSLDLHIEEYGAGEPTIVLHHGFAGSARNLRPQARFLADRHRVVLFDARGHARSQAPQGASDYTIDRFVSDLGAVVERTQSQSVVVGGISLGAAVALRYAIQRPRSLRALILSSYPAPGTSSSPSWALEFARAIEEEGLDAAGERFVWGGTRYDATAAKWIRQGFLEHQPHALVAVLRETLGALPSVEDSSAELSTLDVPTLVIVGERDHLSLAPSAELARLIPHARQVQVPEAGHVVNLEKTQLFNRAMGDFLSGIEP